ncbi:hypothetical protein HAX54_045768 [Datura stramonium]|uniref:Uncharacterized protein n=1 Tax=Datura stramonium TaxID=4076 RepID=A0ABS8WJT1_DATST|nr:hypothetical protein [Datura stramonium]
MIDTMETNKALLTKKLTESEVKKVHAIDESMTGVQYRHGFPPPPYQINNFQSHHLCKWKMPTMLAIHPVTIYRSISRATPFLHTKGNEDLNCKSKKRAAKKAQDKEASAKIAARRDLKDEASKYEQEKGT